MAREAFLRKVAPSKVQKQQDIEREKQIIKIKEQQEIDKKKMEQRLKVFKI
jgi:hypothetical protein